MVFAVFCASFAALIRPTTMGTLSATTPSSGTSTSRASLPRMRNLPKSTGSLPPCRVDLAVGRELVVRARAVSAGAVGGDDVPGRLADRQGRRRVRGLAAAGGGGRPDQ